ncbi:MAG: segregation/condensation protein A [Bifidobacteriaceae bacterium]|jgi:segregation and condensation protein A|nr:segregation/condensation protein A [Bifidobacteriaceae bacterium]
MSEEFIVSQPAFSGSYSLMLELIRKNKLDISKISLYSIVDEFLVYVNKIKETNKLSEMSDFCQTATLMLKIKLSVLLPKPESLMTEEDFELLEAKDILFAKLLQYSAFQTVAKVFDKQINAVQKTYPRIGQIDEMEILPPLKWNITGIKLAKVFSQVLLAKMPDKLDISYLHNPKYLVITQRQIILRNLTKVNKLSFNKLVKKQANPLVTCVIFLTLLIMYKDREIELRQAKHLSDINIMKVKK